MAERLQQVVEAIDAREGAAGGAPSAQVRAVVVAAAVCPVPDAHNYFVEDSQRGRLLYLHIPSIPVLVPCSLLSHVNTTDSS